MLRVKFKRDEFAIAGGSVDIAHPSAPRDAARGLDEDIAEGERAVFIRTQIAAPKKLAGDLAGGECGFYFADAGHGVGLSLSDGYVIIFETRSAQRSRRFFLIPSPFAGEGSCPP